MGNPKQKWTAEEEEALRAGVLKHGAGKWKNIQRDPEFNKLLFSRSNIDLKDKWRNLSVASGQTPRDKSKAPKPKGPDAPATPLPIAHTSSSTAIIPFTQDVSTEVVMGDTSKPLSDGNTAAKYNAYIYEALSTVNEPNGLDCSSLATLIEKRHEVPQNFKRQLSSRLRRLVQQDKLEKAQNCYRLKSRGQAEARSPVERPKESQPRPVQSIGHLGDTVEEAATSAAYKVAEAENKSFVAAEAVKEAERVSTMAEDMEALLQFAMECFDQSAQGEILIMA